MPTGALARVRRDVRKTTRQAQLAAQALAASTPMTYAGARSQLFDAWMAAADRRARLVCFASAVELGLPVARYFAPCRQAVEDAGDTALRALFWAACRRLQGGVPAGMQGEAVARADHAGCVGRQGR